MCLMTYRLNFMCVVGSISRYMGLPIELYLQALKRALRYLRGIINLGVFYKKGGNEELIAYN